MLFGQLWSLTAWQAFRFFSASSRWVDDLFRLLRRPGSRADCSSTILCASCSVQQTTRTTKKKTIKRHQQQRRDKTDEKVTGRQEGRHTDRQTDKQIT